jgi:GTP cyclohydrolase IIa
MAAYSAFLKIRTAVDSLRHYMDDAHGVLTFFVGGDSAISVCPELPREAFEEAIEHVRGETAVELQMGAKNDTTARPPGLAALYPLECRHRLATVDQ